MSNEIIKVLDELGKRFGIAIDWTSENVIPYLKYLCGRLVNWELTKSCIWIVLCLVIIVGWFIFLYKNKEFGVTHYSTIPDDKSFRYVPTVMICVIFGAALLCNTFNVAECLVFPEKVIFDEIMSIYQTMQ